MSSTDNALDVAARVLRSVLYATVATASRQGEPWNSPVYAAYDKELSVFWTSGVDAQHSRNIRETERAFVVIYDSSVPEGTGVGLYLRCEAVELAEAEEVARGLSALAARVDDPVEAVEDLTNDSPRRVYRATPDEAWINDQVTVEGAFVDTRAPVDLFALRRLLFP